MAKIWFYNTDSNQSIKKNSNVYPKLLLLTEVIIIIYYLDFSNKREELWGVSLSSVNDKNVDVRDRNHVKNTLPLSFEITEG